MCNSKHKYKYHDDIEFNGSCRNCHGWSVDSEWFCEFCENSGSEIHNLSVYRIILEVDMNDNIDSLDYVRFCFINSYLHTSFRIDVDVLVDKFYDIVNNIDLSESVPECENIINHTKKLIRKSRINSFIND